jgi:hypothetical protein
VGERLTPGVSKFAKNGIFTYRDTAGGRDASAPGTAAFAGQIFSNPTAGTVGRGNRGRPSAVCPIPSPSVRFPPPFASEFTALSPGKRLNRVENYNGIKVNYSQTEATGR